MSKTLTPFEEQLRGAVERYEAPYESEQWSALERSLGSGRTAAGSQNSARLVALAATVAACALIGASVFNRYFDIPQAEPAYTSTRFVQVDVYHVLGGKSVSLTNSTPAAADIARQSNDTQNTADIQLQNSNAFSNRSSTDHAEPVSMTQHPLSEVTPESIPSTQPQKTKAIPGTAIASNKVAIASDVRQACMGYEVAFQVTDGPTKGSYLWNFGDGSFSVAPRASHTYKKPGVYDVSLSITSDDDGSIRSTTMDDMITINPSPEADFEWDFVNAPTSVPTVKFINMSENASQSVWTFDSGEATKDISPMQSFVNKGKYAVELFVKNEYGCTDNQVKYVTINSDYNLLAPDQFSPNGDGKEDMFMPEALRLNNFNFNLTVYNEAGQLVYQTSNKTKGWNGSLPDGSVAPVDSQYHWIVLLKNDITHEDKYFSGTVSVIP